MPPASCRDRLELALFRIAEPDGEGARICLTVYAEAARAAADAADARAAVGVSLGPLDGAIVTIKDLFDVAGEPTRAGSKVLAEEAPPAAADAAIVRRLRAAGAVIVAKTNMTEFAFSGVGANPHFGTPGNPHDRKRVPGGSSSGAAVAVADGIGEIAIGTDTGGSVRIPAALTGIVGFKPSRQRIPTDGAFPFSTTLDSIGPLARTVTACAKADAIMAGADFVPLEPVAVAGLRFGIAQGVPLDRLDHTVAAAFAAAIGRLENAGVRLSHETLSLFDDWARSTPRAASPRPKPMPSTATASRGAVPTSTPMSASASSAAATSAWLAISTWCGNAGVWCGRWTRGSRGSTRSSCRRPPIVAPTIAEVADPKTFGARNAALLRNPSIANFFDLCAVSLPLPAPLPVGLMLVARNGEDRMLLRIAAAVEQVFAG